MVRLESAPNPAPSPGPSHDRICTRCGTRYPATTLCPVCYDFPRPAG